MLKQHRLPVLIAALAALALLAPQLQWLANRGETLPPLPPPDPRLQARPADPGSPPPTIHERIAVTPEEVYTALSDPSLSAVQKEALFVERFRGKRTTWSGTVDEVVSDWSDGFIVWVRRPEGRFSVEVPSPEAASLSIGSPVTLSGVFDAPPLATGIHLRHGLLE